jgi:ADP-ribose pyrophosphatase YjhB (NUDIX family)
MERLKLKVAVYIILTKEDKILLSRRFNTGWQDGNYGLPSGHLEAGEMLIEALLRETAEEIGVKLNQEDIKFVHIMHRKSNYIDFFFTAKSWVGDPKNMEPNKSDDLQWFPLNALPDNIVPSVKRALQNYQNGVLFSEFQSEG